MVKRPDVLQFHKTSQEWTVEDINYIKLKKNLKNPDQFHAFSNKHTENLIHCDLSDPFNLILENPAGQLFADIFCPGLARLEFIENEKNKASVRGCRQIPRLISTFSRHVGASRLITSILIFRRQFRIL